MDGLRLGRGEVGVAEASRIGRLCLLYSSLDGDLHLRGEAFFVRQAVLRFVGVAVNELERGELMFLVSIELCLGTWSVGLTQLTDDIPHIPIDVLGDRRTIGMAQILPSCPHGGIKRSHLIKDLTPIVVYSETLPLMVKGQAILGVLRVGDKREGTRLDEERAVAVVGTQDRFLRAAPGRVVKDRTGHSAQLRPIQLIINLSHEASGSIILFVMADIAGTRR